MTGNEDRTMEDGSSTVQVAAWLMIVAIVAGIIMHLLTAGTAQARAQNLADLAAISAATLFRQGIPSAEACAQTETLVAPALLQCNVDDAGIATTMVVIEGRWRYIGAVSAQAKAGPSNGQNQREIEQE